MSVDSDIELLKQRLNINTACGCALEYDDDSLVAFYRDCGSDVDKATYRAFIRRAENDEITLPDGVRLPSERSYWLNMARLYRANNGGTVKRADAVLQEAGTDG